MKRPPRSPDLTPCDSFLWGYVKERAFVPPLPLDADELNLRIIAVTETIGRNAVSWITDWTFVGSRMELTFSTFRAGKTFSFSFKWHELELYGCDTHLGVTN
jgi:hypothetical protein